MGNLGLLLLGSLCFNLVLLKMLKVEKNLKKEIENNSIMKIKKLEDEIYEKDKKIKELKFSLETKDMEIELLTSDLKEKNEVEVKVSEEDPVLAENIRLKRLFVCLTKNRDQRREFIKNGFQNFVW